jgi:hypothetical protein
MIYKHHIIPLHEWKCRINPKATRYDKEFNAPDNTVWLSLEQHIQVHQLLFEINGSEFDSVAWRGLSGQIDGEEANIQATKVANSGNGRLKGYVQSKQHVFNRAMSCGKTWRVSSPDEPETIIKNLASFSRRHGLKQDSMRAVADGRLKTHKGWLCQRIAND